MTTKNKYLSITKVARITGLLGLVVLICGSLAHSINSEIIDLNNEITTADNFKSLGSKYRIGFVCGLIMETVFIFYAFLLFYILRITNRLAAILMLILALIPAPLFYANQLNHFASFLISEHSTSQMMFYLELHKNGGYIISIFFGLWLFPLGYLVYKSSFLPKFLGVFLMIGCFGYLLSFIQGFLFPNYISSLWTNPFLVITHISEILFMLCLLFKGIKKTKYFEQMES
jgi:hypothetical protein